MRTITSHVVNPANDRLKITVHDEPGPGGANHEYTISLDDVDDPLRDGHPGQPRVLCRLMFQNGPINADGNGVNGITHEALIAILMDRLMAFQAGPYANDYNATALSSLGVAQLALQSRTKERMARGVEGTHKV